MNQMGVSFFITESAFETRFGPSTQVAGIRYQNTSQIQILLAGHFEKKGGRCYNLRLTGLDLRVVFPELACHREEQLIQVQPIVQIDAFDDAVVTAR